jgi:DNA-binding transcriptional LysR family regulator
MLAARDPRLVAVLPRTVDVPAGELWVVMHQDARHAARVAAVFAWLVDVLGAAGSASRPAAR